MMQLRCLSMKILQPNLNYRDVVGYVRFVLEQVFLNSFEFESRSFCFEVVSEFWEEHSWSEMVKN